MYLDRLLFSFVAFLVLFSTVSASGILMTPSYYYEGADFVVLGTITSIDEKVEDVLFERVTPMCMEKKPPFSCRNHGRRI
jgi:hypothetical protein